VKELVTLEGATEMKYMLLMSANKEVFEWYSKWPKEELQANMAFMRNIAKELTDEGVLIQTAGLAWPHQAVIVRANDEGQPITDGVFPESKEFLAGYWMIDVENAEEAYKVAARISMAPAPKGTPEHMPLEVREVMDRAPEEMC
jgi:hypothetical protein